MIDQTAIPVTYPSVSPKGKFFAIEPSFWGDGKVPGLEIANKTALRVPGTYVVRPPTGDPNQYLEKPHLGHVPELGGMPRDFEDLAGIWIVSERLKQVFKSVDPEGFAFAACDLTLADGSPGPQYYFCGVLRTLDALDEGASRLKIKISDDYVNGKHYSLAGGASLGFKEEVIGSAHIFRTPFSGMAFCDRALYDALSAANLDGVRLRDAADL